MTNNDLFKD